MVLGPKKNHLKTLKCSFSVQNPRPGRAGRPTSLRPCFGRFHRARIDFCNGLSRFCYKWRRHWHITSHNALPSDTQPLVHRKMEEVPGHIVMMQINIWILLTNCWQQCLWISFRQGHSFLKDCFDLFKWLILLLFSLWSGKGKVFKLELTGVGQLIYLIFFPLRLSRRLVCNTAVVNTLDVMQQY